MQLRRVGRTKRGTQGPVRRNSESSLPSRFPTKDRFTRSGHRLGDICFQCECRVLEIGGPEGMLLAWCECGWPAEHLEMEIG